MSLLMLCSPRVTVVYLPAALLRAQTLVFCSVDGWFWGYSPSRGDMLHLSGMVCHLHFTAWDLLWWTYVTYLISLTSLIIKKWIENGSFGVFRGQSRLLAITSFNRVHITSHSTFIEIIFLSCPIFKTESYLLKVADFPQCWYRLTQVVLEKRPLNGCCSPQCHLHLRCPHSLASETESLGYCAALFTWSTFSRCSKMLTCDRQSHDDSIYCPCYWCHILHFHCTFCVCTPCNFHCSLLAFPAFSVNPFCDKNMKFIKLHYTFNQKPCYLTIAHLLWMHLY